MVSHQVGRELKAATSVGYRAAENGHVIKVARDGKRFRLTCRCGFITPINGTRKATFELAVNHAGAAARGDIPALPYPEGETGVSLPDFGVDFR